MCPPVLTSMYFIFFNFLRARILISGGETVYNIVFMIFLRAKC